MRTTEERVQAVMHGAIQVSALERFYRFFWRNKGDIYHVLWDLTRCESTISGICMFLCRHTPFLLRQWARSAAPKMHMSRCCSEEECMWRRFLDGRVWPLEDEKQVKLMMAMIHHCTGVPSLLSQVS